MAGNKGKPSGQVAPTKKEPGRQGDLKEFGAVPGSRKKRISKTAGIRAVTGTEGSRKVSKFA